MRRITVECDPGEIVELAGVKFVVLDVERSYAYYPDTLFILTLHSVGQSCFGESNDYEMSELRDAIGEWLKVMEARGFDSTHVVSRKINLTTLDGHKGYGEIWTNAAPLTLDEAREYAYIIPNAEQWCWLATGWSGPSKSDGDLALCVNSVGDWVVRYCSESYGIRPALKAPSILFEDSEAGLDLSKVATDDLLREIRKRISPKMEEKNDS